MISGGYTDDYWGAKCPLRKFTFSNGEEIYINPAHVVSVRKAAEYYEKDHGPGVELQLGDAGWIVPGTPEEVLAQLYG